MCLSHRGTKECTPASNKLVSSVSNQEMRDCFMSVSAVNRFPARCFVRDAKIWKSLTTRLALQAGQSLTSYHSVGTSPVGSKGSSVFQVLVFLTKDLDGKRFTTHANVKPAVTSWSQTIETDFFQTEIQKWCHRTTNAEASVTSKSRPHVYHLLSMCHVYMETGKAFSASECLLPYILHFFYYFLPKLNKQKKNVVLIG